MVIEWQYKGKPADGTDSRKLVTLEQDGMVWVGIRAWNGRDGKWMNNGEPSSERVLAWTDMPAPATGRWVRGQLLLAEPEQALRARAEGTSERAE